MATVKNVAVVAHRGGAALAPENTLGAFAHALKLGVDMVECDVHLSKDGEVVIMHDKELSRTTDGTGPITEKTLAELKQLNAAAKVGDHSRVERIPTLGELLDLVKGKSRIQIEIKEGSGSKEPTIERKVLELLHARGMTHDAIIISFDCSALLNSKSLDPSIQTGALVGDLPAGKSPEEIAEDIAQTIHADYYLPYYAQVTQALIDAMHEQEIRMGAWTVNTEPEMRRLAECGIDAITTDAPDVLMRVLGR